MAYIGPIGSTVAFQGTVPWSVLGANQSVSGTVNVGNFPGSVVSFQGGAWAHTNIGSVITVSQGSVATVIIGGSIAASFTPPANQSVSGTVQTDVRSSVAVVIIGGSIAASFTPPANQSVSGTVQTQVQASVGVVIIGGSILTSSTANQSVSGTVNVGSILTTVGYVSPGNSISSQMSTSSVFTGAWEEVKDFSAIYVTVNSDVASAADGLALQRSTNASSVITSDVYTIPAQTGKTLQIQPDARYFRVQYTNSAANQGAMALQTVYKQNYSKPSSQRPSDGYTNETDLEQMQGFNMLYNGATWDRMRGTTAGALVTGSVQQGTSPWIVAGSVQAAVGGSVVAFQGGTQITSISGNLVISSASISGNVGVTMAGSWNVGATGVGSVTVVVQSSSILAVPVGSVVAVLQAPSIVGTYAEDAAHTSADKGLFGLGVRNDTLSSVTSTDGDYSQMSTGPVGEMVTANAPINKWVQGTGSMLGGIPLTSSVIVIAAQGASVFTYITGVQIVNMTSANVMVALYGATDSIIGRTIAPGNGGSNIVFPNAIKTNANGAFSASVSGTASIYIAAQGFISKT